MKLRHKKPCNECPFRRVSPAGWLGGYEPEEFTSQIQFDGPPLPCHKTIRQDETNDYAALPDYVSMCAGALIHMKNSCKAPYHEQYGDALSKIEADPENVFNWPHEFLNHHKDPDAWIAEAKRKIGERK